MEDFTWRVGGPQGGGIETAATLFARAVGKGGWWAVSYTHLTLPTIYSV